MQQNVERDSVFCQERWLDPNEDQTLNSPHFNKITPSC